MSDSSRIGDKKGEVSFGETNTNNIWEVVGEDGSKVKIECISGADEGDIKTVSAVNFYSSAKYMDLPE